MLGALVGSFIAALIDKLPEIEQAIGRTVLVRELKKLSDELAGGALAIAAYRDRLQHDTDENDERIRRAEAKLKGEEKKP